jgi:branched-subunit amino acid transport protein
MNEFVHIICILGLAAITVLTRAFFFMTDRPWNIPSIVERGLQFAPIAALAAVIVPEILMVHSQVDLSFMNAKIYGALGGAAFYFITRGKGQAVFGTIVVGMLIYLPLHLGLGMS